MGQEQDPRLIEKPIRLSQSKLWQIQKNYFTTMEIKAWKEEVPFYVSSNAFIGHQYALLVVNFIKDWLQRHSNHAALPFYIVELGSGTGKFSFHFLKEFKKLLAIHRLEKQKFCYIMTDLVEGNVNYCQVNKDFQGYIQSQEIDFASFDVEQDRDFHLRLQDKPFSKMVNDNPVIFIVNYTFDCIRQDAFECKEGNLLQVNVGLHSRYKNFDIEKSQHLEDLRINYDYHEVQAEGYYDNPALNTILTQYTQEFKEAANSLFMMPTGAIDFLDQMRALTQDNYFMIVGDKGVAQLSTMSLLTPNQRVTFDGCYSFLVNFHALGEYLKKVGGDALLTQKENDFKVNLYCAGTTFNELPGTSICYNTVVEKLGPDEYCYIYDEYLTSSYRFSLPSLLAFLRLSQWDPDAYAIIHERLLELLPAANAVIMQDIKMAVSQVKDNIYSISYGEDAYNLLGIFYQTQGMNDMAMQLYQNSISVVGDKAPPYHNAAMIYEEQRNFTKALDYYQKAYSLDKKNLFARKKIWQLSGRPLLASLIPLLKGTLVFALLAGAMFLMSR